MPVQIDSDFPGGNIVVEGIDSDSIHLHQDLRDTTRDWFYWCFRVCGAAGRTLRFVFTQSRALGVHGPAVSLDQGETWRWLASSVVEGNTFSWTLPEDSLDVRLSFAMPYQRSHWLRFADRLGSTPSFSRYTLCTTAKGRHVEFALVGCNEKAPRYRVAVTCRHHCCEMMASYSLEGLIQYVLSDDDADSHWLRENVQFFVVPLVDMDGVEDGDQGKSRRPRDHGRDYEGESIFATTKAIRTRLPGWGDGRLCVGLDLHCPWICGPHNEVIYLVGEPQDHIAREQQRFSTILESVNRGPLPFRAADFLPFGQEWNVPADSSDGKAFPCWLSSLPGVTLAGTIEIPYASAGTAEVNQESARGFGRDLGLAVAAYLRVPN